MQDPEPLMEQRLRKLGALSREEASRLPERLEEEVAVAGHACALTTCRQSGVLPVGDAVLVTVQLARSRCFGGWSDHLEKGLVFEPGGGVRVEQVEDPLMQKIRQLDKLVDALAKGKALEKVLRQ